MEDERINTKYVSFLLYEAAASRHLAKLSIKVGNGEQASLVLSKCNKISQHSCFLFPDFALSYANRLLAVTTFYHKDLRVLLICSSKLQQEYKIGIFQMSSYFRNQNTVRSVAVTVFSRLLREHFLTIRSFTKKENI